jgi:hypothetical protein
LILGQIRSKKDISTKEMDEIKSADFLTSKKDPPKKATVSF